MRSPVGKIKLSLPHSQQGIAEAKPSTGLKSAIPDLLKIAPEWEGMNPKKLRGPGFHNLYLIYGPDRKIWLS